MTKKKNFKTAFGELRVKEAPIVKKTIMKMCKWSDQTWSNKKDGKRGFEAKEAAIVETTFREFGIEAWSGEELITSFNHN
jgi:hypothetical protein